MEIGKEGGGRGGVAGREQPFNLRSTDRLRPAIVSHFTGALVCKCGRRNMCNISSKAGHLPGLIRGCVSSRSCTHPDTI